jgi:hypothetical protein
MAFYFLCASLPVPPLAKKGFPRGSSSDDTAVFAEVGPALSDVVVARNPINK